MDISDSEISDRLDRYKRDLKYPSIEVVQKHILTGQPVALDEEQYFLLRNRVGKKFNVLPVEVILVGSCRIGFTLVDKPDRKRPRYSPIHQGSDLDIAVVSSRLFDVYWEGVYQYSAENLAFSTTEEGQRFRDTLFQGWIEPDALPPAHRFSRAREWFEFFRQISQDRQYGNRRASARVYRSWDRLTAYQQRAVEQCQRQAKGAGK
jgi:hypothetical protein